MVDSRSGPLSGRGPSELWGHWFSFTGFLEHRFRKPRMIATWRREVGCGDKR
jgi:hypothetical protein